MVYTVDEINAALERVETAKQNHPIGWGMLDELGLGPSKEMVVYAFSNAHEHKERLEKEDDKRVIYATGWLQGLAVGQALRRGGE
jgi:hypothetical protein